VSRQRDLCRAVSLERDRWSRACQLSEQRRELRCRAFLDDNIEVGLHATEQVIADVTADDPRLDAKIVGGSFQQTEQLAVVYWLIRAHSTAPT